VNVKLNVLNRERATGREISFFSMLGRKKPLPVCGVRPVFCNKATPAIFRRLDCDPGGRKVVAVLEVKPKLRFDSKITIEPQGGIGGDAQFLARNAFDARTRDSTRLCHRIGRNFIGTRNSSRKTSPGWSGGSLATIRSFFGWCAWAHPARSPATSARDFAG